MNAKLHRLERRAKRSRKRWEQLELWERRDQPDPMVGRPVRVDDCPGVVVAAFPSVGLLLVHFAGEHAFGSITGCRLLVRRDELDDDHPQKPLP